MATTREQFSSQASPILLAGMREIAWREDSSFQAVLEESYAQLHPEQGSGGGEA